MADELLQAIENRPHGALLVGFSGGLDSTVLLHLLSRDRGANRGSVRALHVHHGLQAGADAWAAHCRAFCERLGLELAVIHVRVEANGRGPEAAARDARHQAFADNLLPGETLALAHHRDDQAETVLLRLLRGSASGGLAAMRDSRAFAGGILWRPLLGIGRGQLLAYALGHQVPWIEDPSNADQAMDRNFLRHEVLPLLQRRWPGAAGALARSAELLAEDADLLALEAAARLQAVLVDRRTLDVAALLALPKPWRARVIRLWLDELGVAPLPGNAHAVIEASLLGAASEGDAVYHWSGFLLSRWKNGLYLRREAGGLPPDCALPWLAGSELRLPTGDLLAFENSLLATAPDAAESTLASSQRLIDLLGPMHVRARLGGERIRLPGREHSHALKDCLQQAAIPPWRRQRLPLLFAGDGELLAAGDQVIGARLSEALQRHGLRLSLRQHPDMRAI